MRFFKNLPRAYNDWETLGYIVFVILCNYSLGCVDCGRRLLYSAQLMIDTALYGYAAVVDIMHYRYRFTPRHDICLRGDNEGNDGAKEIFTRIILLRPLHGKL